MLLALVAVGVEALARKRDGLLFFGIVSFLLLLPVVNGRFESSVPKARYVAPLLPICFAAIAVALLETWRWTERVAAGVAPFARLVMHGGLGLVALGAVVIPLGGLAAYYQAAIQERHTNAGFFQVVGGIQASRRPGERVYAERGALHSYTLGGRQWGEHLAFAARVYGRERQALDVPLPLAFPRRQAWERQGSRPRA